MHRQQNLLHDVLGVIHRLPCPRQTAPCRGSQHRRDGLEQTMIRRTVARNGRPHQNGPLVTTFAHVRSYCAIRLTFQFVTSERARDRDLCVQGAAGAARAWWGLAAKSLPDDSLITPIGLADTRGFIAKESRPKRSDA